MDLMGSMSDTEIKNAEDFSKFKKDSNLHSEISRRGLGSSNDAPPVVEKRHLNLWHRLDLQWASRCGYGM